MAMFDTFSYLFPRARAWTLVVDRMLRRYFVGLMAPFVSAREYADRMWRDNFPSSTRFLTSWEKQFAFTPGTLTDDERRARLDAVWKAIGGQSPHYITETLQGHGFPVYTHEWWDFAPHGVPMAKDPRDYLLPEFGGNDVDGFLLVNQYYATGKTGPYAQAGEAIMQAGEPKAQAGWFEAFSSEAVESVYCGPESTHCLYGYLGGETFPDTVDIPLSRRTEFERLVKSLMPGHLWIVLRVRYV